VAITNGYCTAAEFSSWIRSDSISAQAIETELAVEAASRMIDAYCGTQFYADSSATARTFAAEDKWLVIVDDISTTTGLVVKTDDDGDGTFEVTWAAADYQLGPENALARGEAVRQIAVASSGNNTFPRWRDSRLVQVTAAWGWPAVPKQVKLACLIQSARLYKRRDAPFGTLDAADFGGVPVRTRLDSEAEILLQPFRRVMAGAAY
jgi:hypothetical protein